MESVGNIISLKLTISAKNVCQKIIKHKQKKIIMIKLCAGLWEFMNKKWLRGKRNQIKLKTILQLFSLIF